MSTSNCMACAKCSDTRDPSLCASPDRRRRVGKCPYAGSLYDGALIQDIKGWGGQGSEKGVQEGLS